MATEPFLVNPPRRRKRFGARSRMRLRNPFAEGLAIVGGNPGRRRRRNAPKKRKSSTRIGSMHRPVFYQSGPKRWSRSEKSRSRKAGIKVNPRRRISRNPAIAAGGPLDIMGNLPYVATGAVSAIAVVAVPSLTGMSARGPIFKYGTQVATAIGGGIVVGKFVSKSHGAVWALVGSAVIMADIVKTYLLGSLGLSGYLGDVDGYQLEAYPDTGIEGYQLEGYGQEDELEAFPDTEDMMIEESPYA